jgi:hypothetical protein
MKARTVYLIAIILAAMMVTVAPLKANAVVAGRTYTTTADFNEGILNGVQDTNPPDQLNLTSTPFALPFIWVPNLDGTVSKLSTEDGTELGRYRVAPPDLPLGGNPSRTAVDQQGNCWVGCRTAGTVVKIGLFENGGYIDRNHDGIIETSHGSTALPWGEDECVLYEVVLIPGHEGTYTPGTYPGPYDTSYWGVSPMGLAIDKDNNLWAGTWDTQTYYYINGATGQIDSTKTVQTSYGAFGAVIDRHGMLWSVTYDQNHTLGIDCSTSPAKVTYDIDLGFGFVACGISLDSEDHLFVLGTGVFTFIGVLPARLAKIDVTTGTVIWNQAKPEFYNSAECVVCTQDNDVWVSFAGEAGRFPPFYYGTAVFRYDNDGNWKATIFGLNDHAGFNGLSVDHAGKVWVCDLADEYAHRIDTNTNTIDLSVDVVGSGGHDSYSDMTGYASGNIATKVGTWTVVFDSGVAGMPWGTVSWHSLELLGTSISVRVQSSEDNTNWKPPGWWPVTNDTAFGAPDVPNGRYLQIQVTLQIISGDVSSVLYDLTVQPEHDVAVINVVPDSDWVYQGKLAHAGINVTVANLGGAPEDFHVILYAFNDTATPPNLVIGTLPVIDLPPNSTLILRFVWDSSDATPCHRYNITAVARAVPYETITDNNMMTSPTQIKVRVFADLNGDGKVDTRDILIAAKAFGENQDGARWLPWGPYADVDNNRKINILDIFIVAKNFGKTSA